MIVKDSHSTWISFRGAGHRIKLKLSTTAIDGTSYGAEVSVRDNMTADIGGLMNEIRVLRCVKKLHQELPQKCKHSRFYILIDDLDDGWNNTPAQRECLRALIASLVKLQHFSNVKFVVSLRKTIFEQLQVDDPDKVRECKTELSWTKANLVSIVLARLQSQLRTTRKSIMETVLPESVDNMAPLNYMYSCLPRHPRSHIQFMQLAADSAVDADQSRIRAEDFHHAAREMSRCYAEDIAFEYKTLYPGLAKLIQSMSGCKSEMNLNEMRETMDNAILLAMEEEDDWELQWVRQITEKEISEQEMNDTLCKVMIRIGVIGVKRSRNERAVFKPTQVPAQFTKKSYFKISPYLFQYLINK